MYGECSKPFHARRAEKGEADLAVPNVSHCQKVSSQDGNCQGCSYDDKAKRMSASLSSEAAYEDLDQHNKAS